MGIAYFWFVLVFLFSTSYAKGNDYFSLDTDFFLNENRLSGTSLSPLTFTVIKTEKIGEATKLVIPKKLTNTHKCFLRYVDQRYIKHSSRGFVDPNSLSENLGETVKTLLKSPFVDMVFHINEDKVEYFIADKLAVNVELSEDDKFSDAVDKFCEILNYNGVVVGVSKKEVTVLVSDLDYDLEKKAVVHKNVKNQLVVNPQNNSVANSLLEFKGKNKSDKMITFKQIVGEAKIWDKVFISVQPPAPKKQ